MVTRVNGCGATAGLLTVNGGRGPGATWTKPGGRDPIKVGEPADILFRWDLMDGQVSAPLGALAGVGVWLDQILKGKKIHRDGVKILPTGVQPQPMKVMFESGFAGWLGERKFCADLDQALALAQRLLKETPSA